MFINVAYSKIITFRYEYLSDVSFSFQIIDLKDSKKGLMTVLV